MALRTLSLPESSTERLPEVRCGGHRDWSSINRLDLWGWGWGAQDSGHYQQSHTHKTPCICNGYEKIPILVERVTRTATVLMRIKSTYLSLLCAVHTSCSGGEEQGGVVAELLEGKDAGKVAVGVTMAAEARPHLHMPRRRGEE